MSFDKNSPIEDSEYLFRVFHFLEWHFGENRPFSGVFKSSNPLSVDRDGEREDSEIIETIRKRPNYELCGLVKNTAEFYRQCETEPIPDPNEENDFHALVNGVGIKGTKAKHAKKLCRNFILVKMAEEAISN